MFAAVEARSKQAQQVDTKQHLFREMKGTWPNGMLHGLQHGNLTVHQLQRTHLESKLH